MEGRLHAGSIPLALSMAGMLLLAACDRQPTTVFDTEHLDDLLMQTFTHTGFICDGIVDARPVGADSASLRISCNDARIYLASIGERGEVCMEPVIYGDLRPGMQQSVRRAGDDAAVGISVPLPIDPSFPPSVRCAVVNG